VRAISAISQNIKKLTLQQIYDLFVIAFENVDTNVDIKDAFDLGTTLLGGKLIPEGARNLGIGL
jgi:hypothetical protein